MDKEYVEINDPEKEFQKTALDACRSTIVQQEGDIRRLNENLDLRNKRIMQLESQVTVATSHLSSRESSCSTSSPVNCPDQLKNLLDSLQHLLTKLTAVPDLLSSKTQTVNVFTNSPNKNSTVTDKAWLHLDKYQEIKSGRHLFSNILDRLNSPSASPDLSEISGSNFR